MPKLGYVLTSYYDTGQLPGEAWMPGETPGDYKPPIDTYKNREGPSRPAAGQYPLNVRGSQVYNRWSEPWFADKHNNPPYDVTTVHVALARYNAQQRPAAPAAKTIPAWALPVNADQKYYRSLDIVPGKTPTYVKVK